MFVLRLTSRDSVRGLESDDGFVIGQLSFQSLFLLLMCTVAGAFNGLCYAVVRTFLPLRGRLAAWAAIGAAVGGSLIIHPDGIDFVFLDPLWLAVVMFTAIPCLCAFLVARTTERWMARPGWYRGRAAVVSIVAGLVSAAALVLSVPALIGAGLIAWLARFRPLRAAVESRAATVAMRTGLSALLAWSSVALARDVASVLG